MEDKKFKMVDEEFVCLNCGEIVKPLLYTARDHCPKCLYSLHVDINPGDRKNPCKGLLVPIGIEKNKKRYRIINIFLQKCDKNFKKTCKSVIKLLIFFAKVWYNTDRGDKLWKDL